MRAILLAVVLIACGCASKEIDSLIVKDGIIIRNVAVVDVQTGNVIPDQSVAIEDGVITAVGANSDLAIQKSARQIDATGKFLIPGLWDSHVHTSKEEVSRETILPLMVANGITGIRSMAADCHIENGACGEPLATIHDVNAWRQEIAAGTLAGPRIIAASYYTNGPERVEQSSIYNPATADHGRAYAHLLNGRGVDLIKVYSGMYREAYFAMANEANKLGLRFSGHVPLTLRASEASDAGQRSIEHITGFLEECSTEEASLRPQLQAGYSEPAVFWAVLIRMAETFSEERCANLYSQLERNCTRHVPTLNVDAFNDRLASPRQDWRNDERMRYVPREEAELWESLERDYFAGIADYKVFLQPHFYKSFEITAGAYKAGVLILAGSDAGEYGIIWGFGLHEELELLVEAGLTNADALRAATLGPAVFFGMEDSLGTVEAGKLADLVILDANPLVDISNTQRISAVIANGRVFDRKDLDRLFENVESAVRESWTGKGHSPN
jgi:hypothetical protein